MTRKPKIDPATTIRNINLDDEEAVYRGERLTEARAEKIAQETLAKLRSKNLIPGGKSLSGGSAHSPRVQFRVPEEIREQVEHRAAAEGVSVSKLARRALEEYLKAS